MWLLPYHLRLALRSLRRDPGLSTTIVVVLAIAAGIFSTALMHYLRNYVATSALPASLHQVEVVVPHEALAAAFKGSNAEPNVVAARERLSFPMLRVLAASGVPSRQTRTFRARVLVGGPHEAGGRAALPPWPRNARFADADLFGMFGLPFRYGGPWTRRDEAGAAPVVVLSQPLNDQLFAGADSVGRTVMVDDRPFRVEGVLAGDQPFSPEWDRSVTGGPQDQLYLPFDEHGRLLARPESPVSAAPEGPRYADLLASDTVAAVFWIDLPTAALRADYARYLEATLGARGVRYTLRDLARLRRELPFPHTVLTFFLFLTFLVLVGGGLVSTRLHLAKSLTRQGELSIFRAVGAPRGAIMARQLLEALVLSTLGGVAAVFVAGPSAYVYNHLIGDTDIPLTLTPASFGITLAATVLVGTLAALYPAWRAAARRPTTAIMRV
jgi:putative ABC transport system permease protein